MSIYKKYIYVCETEKWGLSGMCKMVNNNKLNELNVLVDVVIFVFIYVYMRVQNMFVYCVQKMLEKNQRPVKAACDQPPTPNV